MKIFEGYVTNQKRFPYLIQTRPFWVFKEPNDSLIL